MILGTMSWFEGELPAVPAGDTSQEITIVDYTGLGVIVSGRQSCETIKI
jgi:hypothetical protein